MPKELYINNGIGFLNADVTSAATTLNLVSTFKFPATGNYMIKIDDEFMVVTAATIATPGTMTVTRAQESSTAAGHLNGAVVFAVITVGSLGRLGRQSHGGTNVSARRELNLIDGGGATWSLTDDPTNDKVDVSVAVAIPVSEAAYIKPLISDGWAWNNQQDATATDALNGIVLAAPSSATSGARCLIIPIPSAHYDIKMRIRPTSVAALGFGFVLFDNTNTLFEANTWSPSSGHRWQLNRGSPSVSGGFSTSVDSRTLTYVFDQWWMRVVENGINRDNFISADGVTWVRIFRQNTGAYLTPTHVGFFMQPCNGFDQAVTLMSYSAAILA